MDVMIEMLAVRLLEDRRSISIDSPTASLTSLNEFLGPLRIHLRDHVHCDIEQLPQALPDVGMTITPRYSVACRLVDDEDFVGWDGMTRAV